MNRMKSHPKELSPPLIELGDSPALNNELARVWIADEAHGGNFMIALRNPINDSSACAWVLGRVAFQISDELAKKHNLDHGEVLECLTSHIAINLRPEDFEQSFSGNPTNSKGSNVVAIGDRKPKSSR